MNFNIPTFARLQNPIKLAIIRWIDNQFQQSDADEIVFQMGDLEDGIREILGDPNLKDATIRTHTGNLVSAKPRYLDAAVVSNSTEQEELAAKKYKTPHRDRTFSISEKQMGNLLRVQEDWAVHYRATQLARDSRKLNIEICNEF